MSWNVKLFFYVFCLSTVFQQGDSFLDVLLPRSISKTLNLDPKPDPKGEQYVTINGTVYRQYPTLKLPGSDIKRYQIATSKETQKLCNFKQILKLKLHYYIISESGDSWYTSLKDYNRICKSGKNFIYYISNNYNIVPSNSDENTNCQENSILTEGSIATTAKFTNENVVSPTATSDANIVSEASISTEKSTNENVVSNAKPGVENIIPDADISTVKSTNENVVTTAKTDANIIPDANISTEKSTNENLVTTAKPTIPEADISTVKTEKFTLATKQTSQITAIPTTEENHLTISTEAVTHANVPKNTTPDKLDLIIPLLEDVLKTENQYNMF